jgi:hypothetical protein
MIGVPVRYATRIPFVSACPKCGRDRAQWYTHIALMVMLRRVTQCRVIAPRARSFGSSAPMSVTISRQRWRADEVRATGPSRSFEREPFPHSKAFNLAALCR